MFACILFIVSTGAGFVTQGCVTSEGFIVNPQQVIFVSNGIPVGHVVYSVPRGYSDQWNNTDYQGTEDSYNVRAPSTTAPTVIVQTRTHRPINRALIDTTEFLIRAHATYNSSRRSARRHRNIHRREFRTGSRRGVKIKRRSSRRVRTRRR